MHAARRAVLTSSCSARLLISSFDTIMPSMSGGVTGDHDPSNASTAALPLPKSPLLKAWLLKAWLLKAWFMRADSSKLPWFGLRRRLSSRPAQLTSLHCNSYVVSLYACQGCARDRQHVFSLSRLFMMRSLNCACKARRFRVMQTCLVCFERRRALARANAHSVAPMKEPPLAIVLKHLPSIERKWRLQHQIVN